MNEFANAQGLPIVTPSRRTVLAGITALAAVTTAGTTTAIAARRAPTDAEFLAALNQIPRDKWDHVLRAIQRLLAGDPPADVVFTFRREMGDTEELARRRADEFARELPVTGGRA